MFQNFQKEVANTSHRSLVSVIAPSQKYHHVSATLLKHFSKEATGAYIAINRPYSQLCHHLREKNIDPKKLFVVDCISKPLGKISKESQNCIHLDSPKNLKHIASAVHEFLSSTSENSKNFVFIDTLSTLSLHNNLPEMKRFVDYITSKIKFWGASGVMISLSEELDTNLTTQLSQLCDKTISVK